MFSLFITFLKVNITHFKTDKITSIITIFKDSSSLTSNEISNFDTSKVINI